MSSMTNQVEKLVHATTAFLVQTVSDLNRPMAFVEVKDDKGERGLVVVVRGNERIDKLMPSLRKLCPDDVIRDGAEVSG